MFRLRVLGQLLRASGAIRIAAVAASTFWLAGCGPVAGASVPGGDSAHGAKLIGHLGCGACHIIPGISQAEGLVGPPLDHFGRRMIIAGLLPNTPENLEAWLENPQAIVPGNAMPNMELKKDEARDIATYLYTLR